MAISDRPPHTFWHTGVCFVLYCRLKGKEYQEKNTFYDKKFYVSVCEDLSVTGDKKSLCTEKTGVCVTHEVAGKETSYVGSAGKPKRGRLIKDRTS